MSIKLRNKKSILLTESQFSVLKELITERCFSVSTTVVQLLLILPYEPVAWKTRHNDVVACLVKDYEKKSFYVQVFNLENRQIIWTKDLCNANEYKDLKPQFHILKFDNGIVGFKFYDQPEAMHFAKQIKDKMSIRIPKNLVSFSNSKNSGPKRLTKDDIGLPSEFRVLRQISWNEKTKNFVDFNQNVQPSYSPPPSSSQGKFLPIIPLVRINQIEPKVVEEIQEGETEKAPESPNIPKKTKLRVRELIQRSKSVIIRPANPPPPPPTSKSFKTQSHHE